MKKTLIVMGSLLLSACIAHETDLDVQAARRQANLDARRQATGCAFVRDHDAYRNCIMNTYNMQHPRTYMPAELEDGRPLAIAGGQGCRVGRPIVSPIVETHQTTAWAAPTTTAHVESVETVCERTFQPQEAVVTTTEMPVPAPQPEVIVVEQEQPDEVIVVEQPEEPQTWWATYQETKEPEPKPKCPCEDPNDPCPQCYDK